jgi:hypothetical protein
MNWNSDRTEVQWFLKVLLDSEVFLPKQYVYLMTPTSSQITRDHRRFQTLITHENESALSHKSNNNLVSRLTFWHWSFTFKF